MNDIAAYIEPTFFGVVEVVMKGWVLSGQWLVVSVVLFVVVVVVVVVYVSQ